MIKMTLFYNNINSQLDTILIILLIISISLTCLGRNYRPKHVKLIEIINKIINIVSSWLFILLYQWRTVTQISNIDLSLCVYINPNYMHVSSRGHVWRLKQLGRIRDCLFKKDWNTVLLVFPSFAIIKRYIEIYFTRK